MYFEKQSEKIQDIYWDMKNPNKMFRPHENISTNLVNIL
jgi:hypothetical protein